MTARAEPLTASYASSGWRWPAATSSDAASSGSPRPTRLNGSWRLSPPAGTTAPGGEQGPQRGEAAGRGRRAVAALQEQVRLGERHDPDAGGRDLLGDGGLQVGFLHAEAHAVASGRAVVEAGPADECGEVADVEAPRIERLVDVEVDADGRCRRRSRSTRRGSRAGSGSMCGQPPTTSAPASIASRSRACWASAVGPARPEARRGPRSGGRAGRRARRGPWPAPRRPSRPMFGATSTWVRIAVAPFDSSSSAAARRPARRCRRRSRPARNSVQATMAPIEVAGAGSRPGRR